MNYSAWPLYPPSSSPRRSYPRCGSAAGAALHHNVRRVLLCVAASLCLLSLAVSALLLRSSIDLGPEEVADIMQEDSP